MHGKEGSMASNTEESKDGYASGGVGSGGCHDGVRGPFCGEKGK